MYAKYKRSTDCGIPYKGFTTCRTGTSSNTIYFGEFTYIECSSCVRNWTYGMVCRNQHEYIDRKGWYDRTIRGSELRNTGVGMIIGKVGKGKGYLARCKGLVLGTRRGYLCDYLRFNSCKISQ